MDTKTQQQRLLIAMKNSPMGVNSFLATYQMGIKQAPTRIKELRQMGYRIISHTNKDKSVNWILQKTDYKVIKKKDNKPKMHYIFDDKKQVYLEVSEAEYYRRQQPEQQNLL